MPTHLYKYHPYTAEALESLILGEIWLADPRAFNDPYDVSLRIEEPPSFDDFKRFIEERDSATYSNEEAAEMHEAAKKLHAEIHKEVEAAGIYCVSEICDDFLMWAHYADGHRGFCIEYDTSAMKPEDFEPVRYVDAHADHLSFGSTFQGWESVRQALDEITLTKPSVLAHEKEWRLVRMCVTRYGRRARMPTPVSSLVFGCNTPTAHIRTLMTIATNRFNVGEFTQMQKAEHGYSLVRRPFTWPPSKTHD